MEMRQQEPSDARSGSGRNPEIILTEASSHRPVLRVGSELQARRSPAFMQTIQSAGSRGFASGFTGPAGTVPCDADGPAF